MTTVRGRRVVHVHRDGGISGSERHLLVLLPGLRELGVDARFLSLRSTGTASALEQAMEDQGVPTRHVPVRKHLDPRTGTDLRRVLREVRPDLVHTHLVHADVWGGAASASLRLPLVSSVHAAHNAHLTRPTESALRLVWSRASAIIAISDFVADYLTTRRLCTSEQLRVVKYGLPPLASSPSVPKGGWRGGEGPRVLVASRLIPHKGHAVLLRAWAHLQDRVPQARLVVAGDGPLRTELERLADSLGVSGSVDFLGYQSDMHTLYRQVDAVVFPTEEGFGEGFGLVNLEAMQHGLPVVGSNRPPIPEIVQDGVTGLLVPPGDAPALGAALVRVLQSAETAATMGGAGSRRALAEFAAADMVARTAEVYAGAL